MGNVILNAAKNGGLVDGPSVRVNLQDYLIMDEQVSIKPHTREAWAEIQQLKKEYKERITVVDNGEHYVVTIKARLARMYVKPYTKETIQDLEDLMGNKHVAESVTIQKKDGTYIITSKWEIYYSRDFVESMWGMLFRKFYSQASTLATVLVPAENYRRNAHWHENDIGMAFSEENCNSFYYIVSLSPAFIEATQAPRFIKVA